MCFRISISKHFMMVGVSVMGQWSSRQDFLGTGIMVVVLKHDGAVTLLREMLKMSVRTSANWSAHPLSILPGMLSGPAALCGLTLCRIFLSSALVRHSTCSLGGGVFFLTTTSVFCFKPGIEHIQRIS